MRPWRKPSPPSRPGPFRPTPRLDDVPQASLAFPPSHESAGQVDRRVRGLFERFTLPPCGGVRFRGQQGQRGQHAMKARVSLGCSGLTRCCPWVCRMGNRGNTGGRGRWLCCPCCPHLGTMGNRLHQARSDVIPWVVLVLLPMLPMLPSARIGHASTSKRTSRAVLLPRARGGPSSRKSGRHTR